RARRGGVRRGVRDPGRTGARQAGSGGPPCARSPRRVGAAEARPIDRVTRGSAHRTAVAQSPLSSGPMGARTGAQRVEAVLRAMKSWVGGRDRTRQEAIADLALRALADTDLGLLLDAAAVEIARVLDVEHLDVLGWTPDEDALVLRAWVGWDEIRGSR